MSSPAGVPSLSPAASGNTSCGSEREHMVGPMQQPCMCNKQLARCLGVAALELMRLRSSSRQLQHQFACAMPHGASMVLACVRTEAMHITADALFQQGTPPAPSFLCCAHHRSNCSSSSLQRLTSSTYTWMAFMVVRLTSISSRSKSLLSRNPSLSRSYLHTAAHQAHALCQPHTPGLSVVVRCTTMHISAL